MSEENNASLAEIPESDVLPENLPPVEPPSAGFIVQLFVVPAFIVMAVVGVWLLFGQLASSDQDLSSVIVDLKSDNVHRQWRAAFSLAQILEADAQRGNQGQQLSQSESLATDLSQLLTSQLKITTPTPEDLQKQSYLIRSLGWFDLPKVVFPALAEALKVQVNAPLDSPERELQLELKQSALTSIAQIAGRAHERHLPMGDQYFVPAFADAAGDPDPRLRRMTAFTLSFFSGAEAADRLQAMLVDADEMTRLNAAIGLTRSGSTDSFSVLKRYLEAVTTDGSTSESSSTAESGDAAAENLQKIAAFERNVALKNVVKAIGSLGGRLTLDEYNDAVALIDPISKNHAIPEIRQVALEALKQLQQPGTETD
ncbi:MAG: HEAT repeat domain-containing protein [Planctomycetota bacterium]|nr:HEAT repeat domain-containing protein [Planctomycetota bacterium]